jgi:hypothetical protein
MATIRVDQDQFQDFLLMYFFDLVSNNSKYTITNDLFNTFLRKLIERGLRGLTVQAFYDIPADMRQRFYVVRNIMQGKTSGMLTFHYIYDKKKHTKVIKNHKAVDKKALNKIIGV